MPRDRLSNRCSLHHRSSAIGHRIPALGADVRVRLCRNFSSYSRLGLVVPAGQLALENGNRPGLRGVVGRHVRLVSIAIRVVAAGDGRTESERLFDRVAE